MSYNLKYKIDYYNALNENIVVNLYYNGSVDAVEELEGAAPCLRIDADSNSNQNKYDHIISRTATINILVTPAIEIDHNTFIQSVYTDWKVIITNDGQDIFHGFLIPEQGRIQLIDKPYVVSLKATDGLGLLKNEALTDVDGDNFTDRNYLIEYVAGALKKNTLDLPIRIYSNIYNVAFDDRDDADTNDMFGQAKLHHRTFLKDSNEYVSCYEALEIILKQNFRLFYHTGKWVIYRFQEYTQIDSVWFTDYDSDGVAQSGEAENTTPMNIGESYAIFPINADAFLSNEIAVKSAKHIFNYIIPDDLVNNQSLNRLGDLISPLSGSGYAAYELVGWTQYVGTLVSSAASSAVNAYIKTETNLYGIETDRYYVIEHDPASNAYPLDNYIKNDNLDFWVQTGDRLSISVETRMKTAQTPPPNDHECFLVGILKEGMDGSSISHWYTLASNGTWVDGAGQNFTRDISSGIDVTQWETIGADDTIIPGNGNIFLWLGAGGVDDGNEAHFKNLRITYVPYVNGSLSSVRGDYWLRSQTDGFVDKIEEEVFISDAPKKLIKGALWRDSNITGEALTSPDWYRYPLSENRHFKELTNIGSFGHNYRRMLSIEGTFKGFKIDEVDGLAPLGFHKRFKFQDSTAIQRNFILVPPLSIDIDNGQFTAKFVEVYNDADDINEVGDSSTFNYIF